MRDFMRLFTDVIGLRRVHPVLRNGSIRVSRVHNFERVLVFHRWIEGEGQDVVVVISFDELPKADYAIGLPYVGAWRELLNSDFYDGFPNRVVAGNGGFVNAVGTPLDGFGASASIAIPANGVLVLGKA